MMSGLLGARIGTGGSESSVTSDSLISQWTSAMSWLSTVALQRRAAVMAAWKVVDSGTTETIRVVSNVSYSGVSLLYPTAKKSMALHWMSERHLSGCLLLLALCRACDGMKGQERKQNMPS